MSYLLDTNILIAILHKREPENLAVRSKDPKDLYLSGITIGEIYFGIENSSPIHIEKNRIAREAVLSQFQHLFSDQEISEEYGKIKAELASLKSYNPNNENDIWIAAHARAKSFILVTDNIKDFQTIKNLTIESWSTKPVATIQT
ncbi:MAG: type II toxin-antitoxin system VapC family toxin [Bacteriovoracaceae bacterium]